jgi:hypothetical protein
MREKWSLIGSLMSVGSLRILALALPKLPIFSKFTIYYRSITPLPASTSPLYHAANCPAVMPL